MTRKTGTTKRQLLAASTYLAVGSLAAACGPFTGNGKPTGEVALKESVAVDLWDREDAGYQQFMAAWLPMFRGKHPKVKLTFSPRPPRWQEKLTSAIAGGTPPDVVAVFSPWLRTAMGQGGQAIPLDPFIRAAKFDVQDFLPDQYKAMSWKSQQIAIPQYVNVNVVYYNRELVKQSGLSVPQDDWTHDQFLDYAQRLTRGPLPARDVWGISTGGWSSFDVRTTSLTWGQCGNYNDPKDGSIFTFNTPQNLKAFQWVHDLLWKYRVGSVASDDRGGVPAADAFFATGRAAMLLEGVHLLGTWKSKAQTDWDVAALPKGPCGRGELASVDGYIMPVGAKSPDASWVVIQAITDQEASRMRAEIVGIIPSRKSQIGQWTKTIPGKNLKGAAPTDEVRSHAGALWPRSLEVGAVLYPIFQALFDRNEISVPDALKQANDAIVGLLGPASVR